MDCGEDFHTVSCNFILKCTSGKIPHRRNSLEPDGWAVAAMSEAIAERVADTDQASRAACEWSKGGAKRWFENPITLCSICTKWNVVFWGGIREGNTAWNEYTRLPLKNARAKRRQNKTIQPQLAATSRRA